MTNESLPPKDDGLDLPPKDEELKRKVKGMTKNKARSKKDKEKNKNEK